MAGISSLAGVTSVNNGNTSGSVSGQGQGSSSAGQAPSVAPATWVKTPADPAFILDFSSRTFDVPKIGQVQDYLGPRPYGWVTLAAPAVPASPSAKVPDISLFDRLAQTLPALGVAAVPYQQLVGNVSTGHSGCRSCQQRIEAAKAQAAEAPASEAKAPAAEAPASQPETPASQAETPAVRAISAADALALINSGAKVVMVDERSTRDYNAGHFPGALHIQLHELRDRLSEIPADADAIISFCNCPHGESGEAVAKILAEAGFKNTMYINSNFIKTWTGPLESSDADSTPGFDVISVAEAQAMLESNPNVFLLDVRQPREYAQAHIPGATLIPLDQLPARLSEIPSDADAIIVYCKSGGRSSAAGEILAQAGFGNVLELAAGIMGWTGPTE